MGYLDLADKMILREFNYAQTLDRQKNIVSLFPPFRDRVKKVAAHGGAKLVKMEQDLWTFRVESGDDKRHAKGIFYLVSLFFDKVDQAINEAAQNRANWTKDGRHLNLNALGAWVINHADLATSCSTTNGTFNGREPSSQFWGMNYIKTGRGQEYTHDENRPPDIRNPGQKGVICKHAQLVFDVLPFYAGTMASELKKYYRDFIIKLEDKMVKKNFHGGDQSVATKSEKPVAPVKPQVKVQPKQPIKKIQPKVQEPPNKIKKLSPKQEQELADFNNPPEQEEEE